MDKKQNIFGKGECLSLNQIMDYIHDRLSMKDRNKVERHLIDCELCNEAVEGYSLINDERKAFEINKDLTKQLQTEKVTFEWRKMAAMLAGLLVFASGIYFVNHSLKEESNPIAVKEEKASPSDSQEKFSVQPQDTLLAIKSYSLNKKENDLVGNTNENTQMLEITRNQASDGIILGEDNNIEDKVSYKDGGFTYSFSKTDDVDSNYGLHQKETLSPIIQSTTSVSDESVLKKESEQKVDSKNFDKQYKVNRTRVESKSKKKEVTGFSKDENLFNTTESIEPASEDLEESNKEESKNLVSKPAGATFDNSENIFSVGFNYYNQSLNDKAIGEFDKILKGQKKFEDAQWYKAMALIKKGDKINAKTVLHEIANGNGIYKLKAQQELELME